MHACVRACMHACFFSGCTRNARLGQSLVVLGCKCLGEGQLLLSDASLAQSSSRAPCLGSQAVLRSCATAASAARRASLRLRSFLLGGRESSLCRPDCTAGKSTCEASCKSLGAGMGRSRRREEPVWAGLGVRGLHAEDRRLSCLQWQPVCRVVHAHIGHDAFKGIVHDF